jgi:hypothetical protein
MATLYGTGSKKVRLEKLIAVYGDRDFGSQNRDNGGIDGFREALNRFEHNGDIVEEDESAKEDADAEDS